MEKLTRESIFFIADEEVRVKELLPQLTNLPANQAVKYFQSIGLMLPRKLRMNVLKQALNPYVTSKVIVTQMLSDEVNYRLRWYENFAETQLVNLMPLFKDEKLFENYKDLFWLAILDYMFEKRVSESNFEYLFQFIKIVLQEKGSEIENSVKYNQALNPLFFDESNTIDGLKPEIFRPILFNCSTLVEVREIGRKYGVNVPRRLKKAELVQIIKDELELREMLTEEIVNQIDKMNVIALQRFAMNHDIKASIELKKEEIIEYILKNAVQTKEVYFEPEAAEAYEILDDQALLAKRALEAAKKEPEPVVEKKPEPVVEEKPEPIIEEKPEPIIEERIIERVKEETVVYQQIDTESLERPLYKVIDELKYVSSVVERLKDAVFTILDEDRRPPHEEGIDYIINFAEKFGYEKSGQDIVIQKPIIITPLQVKVTKRKWNSFLKKEKKTKKQKKKESKEQITKTIASELKQ